MKNKRKGSADIILLVILIVLVCATLGYLVWSNMSKGATNSGTENIIKGDNTSITNTQVNENIVSNIPSIEENDAKKKIEKYYANISSPDNAFKIFYGAEYTGSVFYGNDAKYKQEIENGTYILTDINWTDFKNRVHQFISEELYNKKNIFSYTDKPWTKEYDGKLAVATWGLSGVGYTVEKLELLESTEGLYRYKVKGYNGNTVQAMIYADHEVTFRYVDGNYILSEADGDTQKIVDVYSSYKNKLSTREGVSEYKINNIKIIEPTDDLISSRGYTDVENKIFAMVYYSIKLNPGAIDAGNGEREGDWVNNKVAYVIVDIKTNSIIQEGTSL